MIWCHLSAGVLQQMRVVGREQIKRSAENVQRTFHGSVTEFLHLVEQIRAS